MADFSNIAGLSQGGGGLDMLSGLTSLSSSQALTSGGVGGAGKGGQSSLEDLAGFLADALLNGSNGGGSASQSNQSDIGSLLDSLQGGKNGAAGGGGSRGTEAGGGDSAKELLTQVLMALFEKILGGSGEGSGSGENATGGGGQGAGGGAVGGAGQGSGAGGPGAAGQGIGGLGGGGQGAGGIGGGQGLGGAQGGSGSGSIEDLVNTLMQSLGGGSLNGSISPTADGGGQISKDDRLKELLELIGQFMDSHPETFGQPSSGSGGGGSGGGGSAAPAAGGGGAPVSAPSVPAAPGGGGGAIEGGGGGGAAPAPAGPSAPAPAAPSAPAAGPSAGAGTGTPAAGAGRSATPVSFPTASGSPTVVNETIKVGPGEVFDGQGKTFTAGPSLGDGGQGEGQKPIFELAEGATLKNVVFGDNAADGVHVRAGSDKAVNVDNVHWTNVGEDALTVKGEGGAKVTNLNITNSSAQGANDKIFQLNADANVKVDNFKASDFGTFMRTNGGQQGNWNLDLSNISAENGKFSFVKSDSEGLNLTTKNIDLNNVQNAYSKLPGSTNHKEL